MHVHVSKFKHSQLEHLRFSVISGSRYDLNKKVAIKHYFCHKYFKLIAFKYRYFAKINSSRINSLVTLQIYLYSINVFNFIIISFKARGKIWKVYLVANRLIHIKIPIEIYNTLLKKSTVKSTRYQAQRRDETHTFERSYLVLMDRNRIDTALFYTKGVKGNLLLYK